MVDDDATPLLVLEGRTESGEPLLTVTGELDIASQDALRTALVELASLGQKRIVVDLAEVPFMDSSGLNALLAAHREGADVVVRRPTEQVRNLLRLVAVPGVVEVEDEA